MFQLKLNYIDIFDIERLNEIERLNHSLFILRSEWKSLSLRQSDYSIHSEVFKSISSEMKLMEMQGNEWNKDIKELGGF